MKIVKYLIVVALVIALLVASVFLARKYLTSSKGMAANSADLPSLINKDQVFITIDGQDFKIAELLNQDLSKIENDFFDVLKARAVDAYYTKHFDQAKADQSEPSAAEIKMFYDENDLAKQGSLADLELRISDYLKSTAIQKEVQSQFENGLATKTIAYKVALPTSEISFNMNKKAVYGNPTSKVVLVEFSDLQCPFCKQLQQTLKPIEEKYKEQVGFYFYHFPLSIHAQAEQAAVGLECAAAQGQHNAFKDYVFNNQEMLKTEQLPKIAANINGINLAMFSSCLTQDSVKQVVTMDRELGSSLGITGTPTVFIGTVNEQNGQFRGDVISGSLPAEAYSALLDRYLQAKL